MHVGIGHCEASAGPVAGCYLVGTRGGTARDCSAEGGDKCKKGARRQAGRKEEGRWKDGARKGSAQTGKCRRQW
eukprot:26410-Rhodomonas_salina.1